MSATRPGTALAAAIGMVVFAVFAHRGLPWIAVGAAGLVVAAAAIGRSLAREVKPFDFVGLTGLPRRAILSCTIGLAIGVGAAVLDRWQLGVPLRPASGFAAFAPVACLIGAAEELIYRGWMQSALHRLGAPAAVGTAALAHAAYKASLFAWSPEPMTTGWVAIAGWTFAVGIAFGALRETSRSVIPSMLGHAAFDWVVYGAFGHAPWWVWS